MNSTNLETTSDSSTDSRRKVPEFYRRAESALEALEIVYTEITQILERKFTVYDDSTKLYRLLEELPYSERQKVNFRWSIEMSEVMNQFIIGFDEASEVNLSYDLVRKGKRALLQEVLITYLHEDTSPELRQALNVYCECLRKLTDWFQCKLHEAFEEHSCNWWDELNESSSCFGEYEPYLDALALSFNETYINFDLLEQTLAAIRRVIR